MFNFDTLARFGEMDANTINTAYRHISYEVSQAIAASSPYSRPRSGVERMNKLMTYERELYWEVQRAVAAEHKARREVR